MLGREVLLVDDHPLYRAGVRRVLEASGRYRIVAEARCAHEAIEAADAHAPELIVLDVQLPGISGLKTARVLRRKDPRVRIVLVSLFADDARVLEGLQTGAAAMLPRDLAPAVLLDALDRAMAGEQSLRALAHGRPALTLRLRADVRLVAGRRAPQPIDPLPLSTRELAVLDCAAQGLSNKQIAAALFVTEQTVKNHFTSVLRKLEEEDRVGAILHAVRHGWVEIGPPSVHAERHWHFANPHLSRERDAARQTVA
ncbi:MAG: response regulator transcription factor [Thermomicrobiales bacterium]|nr:response regulator transcription factor [Thermomicrobiales bacterium]